MTMVRRRAGWLQRIISTRAMIAATRNPVMSMPRPPPSSSSSAPQQNFPMAERKEERGRSRGGARRLRKKEMLKFMMELLDSQGQRRQAIVVSRCSELSTACD